MSDRRIERCPGACNATPRRAERDHDDATARWQAADPAKRGPQPKLPLLTWARAEPVWCVRCSAILAGRLAELADLVPLLEQDIAGGRGPAGDAPVSGSPGSPSPSPVVDLVDEVLRALEAHEEAYRALRGFPPAPVRAADLRMCLAAAFLQRYLAGALGSAVGVDLGRDITRLHRAVRARTHSDEAKRRMAVPCPRCDLKSLTFRAGDTYVACENCGRLMLLTEYEAHVVELARSHA